MSLSSDNDILMPTSGCATCNFFHTTPMCRSSSETWPRFVLWQWFSLRVLLISSNNKTNLTILTNVKYICQGFPLEKSEIENFNIAVIVHLTVHQGVLCKSYSVVASVTNNRCYLMKWALYHWVVFTVWEQPFLTFICGQFFFFIEKNDFTERWCLRANPLARSPEQVKLDSDKWKFMKEFVWINRTFCSIWLSGKWMKKIDWRYNKQFSTRNFCKV